MVFLPTSYNPEAESPTANPTNISWGIATPANQQKIMPENKATRGAYLTGNPILLITSTIPIVTVERIAKVNVISMLFNDILVIID